MTNSAGNPRLILPLTVSINSSDKQKSKDKAGGNPPKSNRNGGNSSKPLHENNFNPAEATKSWKAFKDKYVGKAIFIKNIKE